MWSYVHSPFSISFFLRPFLSSTFSGNQINQTKPRGRRSRWTDFPTTDLCLAKDFSGSLRLSCLLREDHWVFLCVLCVCVCACSVLLFVKGLFYGLTALLHRYHYLKSLISICHDDDDDDINKYLFYIIPLRERLFFFASNISTIFLFFTIFSFSWNKKPLLMAVNLKKIHLIKKYFIPLVVVFIYLW